MMQSGIKCTQLNGSMSIQARDQTIEKFSNDPDCKVFPLLSLISENYDFDHLFMIWVLTFICLVDFPDEFEGRRCGPEFDSSFSCKNLPCLVLYFAFVCLILFC